MHYKELGKGKPVVMIHGFLENGKMWDEFAEELSQDYHIIIPDLYGHGKTPSVAEVHTMELQATGIVEILKNLKIEKAGFIGHSMGGYTALAIARDYLELVEKLCLFFSTSHPDSEEKKKQRLQAVKTATENQESFVRLGVKNLFDQDKLDELRSEIDFARKLAMEMPLDGITAALKGMRERKDTTAVIVEADYPISIILGRKDPAIDLEKFIPELPANDNIEVDILPVGHMGHLEAPEASLELIKNFLER